MKENIMYLEEDPSFIISQDFKFSKEEMIVNEDLFQKQNNEIINIDINKFDGYVCKTCHEEIPLITAINLDEVTFFCKNCNEKKNVKIKKFFEEKWHFKDINCSICEKKNEDNDFEYCFYCKKILCQECGKDHKNICSKLLIKYDNIFQKCKKHNDNYLKFYDFIKYRDNIDENNNMQYCNKCMEELKYNKDIFYPDLMDLFTKDPIDKELNIIIERIQYLDNIKNLINEIKKFYNNIIESFQNYRNNYIYYKNIINLAKIIEKENINKFLLYSFLSGEEDKEKNITFGLEYIKPSFVFKKFSQQETLYSKNLYCIYNNLVKEFQKQFYSIELQKLYKKCYKLEYNNFIEKCDVNSFKRLYSLEMLDKIEKYIDKKNLYYSQNLTINQIFINDIEFYKQVDLNGINLIYLKELTIKNSSLDFYNLFKINFPNLEKLIIKNNLETIININELKDLKAPNLKILKINEQQLSYLTNFKDLNIIYNNSNLNQIIELDLSSNSILKINDLSQLHFLKYLNLDNNNICDITGLLNKFRNLITLILSNNYIKNIDVFNSDEIIFDDINTIILSKNLITDITNPFLSFISKSKYNNLKKIDLRFNKINTVKFQFIINEIRKRLDNDFLIDNQFSINQKRNDNCNLY